MGDALIFDAVRTPRGRGRETGSLHTVPPVDLLALVLSTLRDRSGLPDHEIDDVIAGCVTQLGGQGACIARAAVLAAGYDEGVPGVTLNRFCGSGLEAVNQAAARVASGWDHLIVAGGVESMSRQRIGSDGGALFDPAFVLRRSTVPQGIGADLLATLENVSREEVDAYALSSQRRAAAALERRAFARSVVSVRDENGTLLLDREEYPRPETTGEKLARLAPAFEALGAKMGVDSLVRRRYPQVEHVRHVHTAGNSSGIVDGAAAVLVGSRAKGAALGLRARARILAVAAVGSEPTIMLSGPMPASEKALKRAGMEPRDIDLFEVNEAFAVVPIVYARHLDLDPALVNVNGGAIAFGHPLGATGAMLLGTVLDELEARNLSTGLVTLCVGGGMGVATILERV